MEIRSVRFHRAAYGPQDFPRDGRPEYAIAGRSNVGKSSFINAILRRQGVARVSQTPGKTQAVQFYLVNERFYIVDLPGYGFARVPRAITASWGTLVRGYLEMSESLRLIFFLIDSRRTPSDLDLDLRDWMLGAEVPWQPVMTKVDKLSGNQLARSRRTVSGALEVDPAQLIDFSSVTRRGVDQVWREIDRDQESKTSHRQRSIDR